jgi:flavin-dependent dehydrogenase
VSASPTYDVAIIGAGPAGGSAAVRLAEAGARTVVIERESLPRPKACGGALSKGPVESVLDWDFGSVVAARGG